jgi:hypothetical protein
MSVWATHHDLCNKMLASRILFLSKYGSDPDGARQLCVPDSEIQEKMQSVHQLTVQQMSEQTLDWASLELRFLDCEVSDGYFGKLVADFPDVLLLHCK